MTRRRFRLADFSPQQQKILLCLRGATRTKRRLLDEVCDALWGDCPDNEPDNSHNQVHVQMYYIRRKLEGCDVEVKAGSGREGGGFYLDGPAAAR